MAADRADRSRRTHRPFNQVLWTAGGLGVAQRQYAQTGRLNPKNLPSILLQAFISLWSGAAVGPEGPLVFLTGGVGSLCADRLKPGKDDIPLLVYCSIAGA